MLRGSGIKLRFYVKIRNKASFQIAAMQKALTMRPDFADCDSNLRKNHWNLDKWAIPKP
jgi:hypothetical protein